MFRTVVTFLIALALSSSAGAQTVGPRRGALVLSGGGEPHADPAVVARFVALAGGADAEIIYILLRELARLLARGGVIGGNSAGAIIQLVHRARPAG